MKTPLLPYFRFVGICLLFSLSLAFAGTEGSTSPGATLQLLPGTASVPTNHWQKFTVNISGRHTTTVVWSVNEIPGGNSTVGSISRYGVYQAPEVVPTEPVVVTAHLIGHPELSASAAVTVVSRTHASVTLSPTGISMQVSQSQQFRAHVTGDRKSDVNWLVNGRIGGSARFGTISSTGLYTAPSNVPRQAVTVVASSVADPAATASAAVSITADSASISVLVSPASTSLQAGQSKQFNATVSGTTINAVNWLVNGTAGGNATFGTISSTGLYTAPAAVPSGAVTVTAQSVAQSTATASAAISITAASLISVSVSPANANLQVGQSKQFNATVSGTTINAVNWLVNGTAGGNTTFGTISSTGLYTAPAAVPSGAVMVTAQSVAQSTATASVAVTVTPSSSISVSISPTSTSLQFGQSQQFSATVSGTSSTGVSWAVDGTLGGNATLGTISSAGLYTAPAAGASTTVTVTAQSLAQSSAMGSATVSITMPTISVSVSPSNPSLEVNQTLQFNAAVSGTTNTAVNWLVSNILGGNSSVGTVSSTGMYTAPANVPTGPVTVTAKSILDSTITADATVTIMPPSNGTPG
ncbi:MAG: Ig-like domain-containing protein, partial [Acidobacteria bacterium]|nr:Ig-like domain-containing protein [Acidobacteriota bacterium]